MQRLETTLNITNATRDVGALAAARALSDEWAIFQPRTTAAAFHTRDEGQPFIGLLYSAPPARQSADTPQPNSGRDQGGAG